MLVVAKHRVLRTSVVVVDGTRYRVRREGDGAFRTEHAGESDVGHIVYHGERDWAAIERTEGRLEILFHTRGTDFDWDRRTYHLGDMLDGDIRIREQGRLVVEGRVTVSGARLRTLQPDLDAIIRELAFVLALRSESSEYMSAPNQPPGPRPW